MVGKAFDRDQLAGFGPLQRSLDVGQRPGRAEVADSANLPLHDRVPPGPQQRVEAAGALVGQLDLDRLGRVAEEDQVGSVEASGAALGGEDPLALGALAGEDLGLREQPLAATFELDRDVGAAAVWAIRPGEKRGTGRSSRSTARWPSRVPSRSRPLSPTPGRTSTRPAARSRASRS